jgi:hypothetical protein
LEKRQQKFPTIGKTVMNFSNGWKNDRRVFPMIGNFSKGWKNRQGELFSPSGTSFRPIVPLFFPFLSKIPVA